MIEIVCEREKITRKGKGERKTGREREREKSGNRLITTHSTLLHVVVSRSGLSSRP